MWICGSDWIGRQSYWQIILGIDLIIGVLIVFIQENCFEGILNSGHLYILIRECYLTCHVNLYLTILSKERLYNNNK